MGNARVVERLSADDAHVVTALREARRELIGEALGASIGENVRFVKRMRIGVISLAWREPDRVCVRVELGGGRLVESDELRPAALTAAHV
jgi:hypothetical protein